MSFIFSFWNTKHFCFHLQPAEPPARHNPVDVQTPDGAPVVVDADVRIGAAAEVRPGPALAVALEEEITKGTARDVFAVPLFENCAKIWATSEKPNVL